jgi:hypothetical protein
MAERSTAAAVNDEWETIPVLATADDEWETVGHPATVWPSGVAPPGIAPVRLPAELRAPAGHPAAAPHASEVQNATGGEFLGNIAKSGANLIGGLYGAVTHPVDTVTTLGKVGVGAVQKASQQPVGGQDYTPYADAAGQALKERYGSVDAIKKTAYEDPVGVAADVSAVASGVSGLARGAASVGRVAGLGRTANALTKTADVAKTVSKFTDPMNAVAKVAAPVAKVAGKVGSETLGVMTGAGGEAVRTAFNHPSAAFKGTVRGKISETEVLGDFKDALQKVKDQRGQQYRSQLAEISGKDHPPIPDAPIRQELDAQLQRFNIRTVPEPTVPIQAPGENNAAFLKRVEAYNATSAKWKPGQLDFSQSTIHSGADQRRVRSIVTDIQGWTDWSPLGVDTLKRRVRDFYSDSSQARALVKGMDAPITASLNQVPGYLDMTSDYRTLSKLIGDAESELSLGPKSKPGTAIRKLSYALNQNNEYRKMLIEALDQYSPGLKDQVAGSHMSRIVPRGLARYQAGGLAASGAVMTNPLLLTAAAMSSPRVVAELLMAASKAKRLAKPLSAVLDPAVYRSLTASQGVNQQLQHPALSMPQQP